MFGGGGGREVLSAFFHAPLSLFIFCPVLFRRYAAPDTLLRRIQTVVQGLLGAALDTLRDEEHAIVEVGEHALSDG